VPTRTIDLTTEQDSFLNSCVKSGRYGSSSEVMCAALRLQEQQECEYTERMDLLRMAVEQELANGAEDTGMFARLREAIGRPNGDSAGQHQAGAE